MGGFLGEFYIIVLRGRSFEIILKVLFGDGQWKFRRGRDKEWGSFYGTPNLSFCPNSRL